MPNSKLFDRVKMSVSGTPGTGTVTLGTAASGYRSFSGAGVSNGNEVSYLIEDGASWEFGTGTYTSSGTTLSRDTVTASSAGGTTKISVTSAAYVYITALTADLVQYDSAGNVGVGTGSPTSKLQVAVSLTDYNDAVYITNSSSGAGSWARVGLWSNSNYSYFGVTNTGEFNIANMVDKPLILYTNATERVNISNAGYVNVGTSGVAAKLYVSGNAASNIAALTDASTIAVDMSTANNFSVTLGGNRTLGNPTNLIAGQSGVIFITQDGTGGRTLGYSSYWDFPNATAPTLTTTASAVDVLVYSVRSTTSIAAQLLTNIG